MIDKHKNKIVFKKDWLTKKKPTMTVQNMMLINMAIILIIYSKNTVLYCLDLISRDAYLFNYIFDRKSLINTIFCAKTERLISV